MNKYPIDIIIPWVNSNDIRWRNEFTRWKRRETGNTSDCRFRDWGFIKYVLRSIEQHCPWSRYVILVLSSPSQIPSWLNTQNPKLKIVYHSQYIPRSYLPTFNSNVIEMFFYNIPFLSENFISCNDDMIFTQPLKESFFFVDDMPVCNKSIKHIYDGEWDKMLNNCINVADMLTGSCEHIMYDTFHLPVAYKKSLQAFLMNKIRKQFFDAFSHSRFRLPKNLTHLFFFDMQCKMNICHFTDKRRGQYYRLDHINSIPRLFKNPMVCLNENEFTQAEHVSTAMSILNIIFEHKSSFEV